MAIGAAQEAYVRALAGSTGITLATHVVCDRVNDDRLRVSDLACTALGDVPATSVSASTRRRAVQDLSWYLSVGVPYTLEATVARHAREESRATRNGGYDLPAGTPGVRVEEGHFVYALTPSGLSGPVPGEEDPAAFLRELHERVYEVAVLGDGTR